MLNGTEMEERLAPLLQVGDAKQDRVNERFRERELILLLHDNAKRLCKRDVVNRTDMFYDMFPSYTIDENESVWCIPIDHPLHIIMEDYLEKEFYAIVEIEYIQVPVAIWLSDDVQDAIDHVMVRIDDVTTMAPVDFLSTELHQQMVVTVVDCHDGYAKKDI